MFIFSMVFRRNFAPAAANSANVKFLQEEVPVDDGTSKASKVAEDDLRFWITDAAVLLPQGINVLQQKC